MKILKSISVILLVIILFSCEKENNVDMSFLEQHDFLYSNMTEYENDDVIVYDTTVYSFKSADSVVAYRTKTKQILNQGFERIKTDTTCRRYYIKENKIMFGTFDSQHIYESDYLLDLSWEVVSQTDMYLEINLFSNQGFVGNTSLYCLKNYSLH